MTALTDAAKSVITVWDFPSIKTRFSSRPHPLVILPSGWTLFDGAMPKTDKGTKFDLLRAKLTIGDSSFTCPDINQTLTQWLIANDAVLSGIPVIRLQGLAGQLEADYLRTYWMLSDYGIHGKTAGGYIIELVNAFSQMSNSVYDDFDPQSYELEATLAGGDTTEMVLKITGENPASNFRTPGFVLMSDAHRREVIRYTSIIFNEFDIVLSGLTREYYGAGSGNYTWLVDETSAFHVWLKRGSPVDNLLEWITTTLVVPDTPVQHILNADLESWSTDTNLDDFTESNIFQEQTTVRSGVSACGLWVDLASAQFFQNQVLKAQRGFTWEFYHYLWSDPGITKGTYRVRITNTTRNKVWNIEHQVWEDSGSFSRTITITRFDEWLRFHASFNTIDPSFTDSDVYEFHILCDFQPLVYVVIDDWAVVGPYMTQPNGPYDLMNGDGVGVPAQLVNFDQCEFIRDQLWPTPTFDGAGNRLTGSAQLFVETERIDDMKKFVEDHILLPYGLKPLLDGSQRFAIDRYHTFFPTEFVVGDKWVKSTFNASKWKRNYESVINNFLVETDFDAVTGELVHSDVYERTISISQFKKSKPLSLLNRGGRSGRYEFPNYGSVDDGKTAAGRIGIETENPWSHITVEVFFEFYHLSQIDAILINVPHIVDFENNDRGVTLKRFFVDNKRFDINKGTIKLLIRERRELGAPLIGSPALVQETGAPVYGAASAENKLYCYISPISGGNFGDGRAPYKII